MAWRESRAAWRSFTGLVACVALGVAAIVGVAGFAESLGLTLGREGRALMGGDLEVRSVRPLEADATRAVGRLAARGAAITRVRELAAMARTPAAGPTLLVEVKAVDDAYPLYGRLETAPPHPQREPLGPDEALVQPALLGRLGLDPGGLLAVGDATFRIAGTIVREPDRPAGLVTLGPRVLVSAAGLDRTGLVRFGSRVRYRTLVRLTASLDVATERTALAGAIAAPAVRVATFADAQPRLRRLLGQVTTYLGLVGLTSLLVGGIGVAASVHTFVGTRLVTIAVLRVLGATAGTLFRTYLAQTLALGALASLLGVLLGIGVTRLLTPLLAAVIPVEVDARVTVGAASRGVLMGGLATLLCALWPLLRVRTVPALAILRLPIGGTRPGGRGPLAAAGIAAALVALVLWQAGSLAIGGIFAGAGAAAIGLLALVAIGVRRSVRRLPRLPSLAWRYGLANLDRPGSHALGVVVALGVGVMLLTTVA